jgi:hypothetical protein
MRFGSATQICHLFISFYLFLAQINFFTFERDNYFFKQNIWVKSRDGYSSALALLWACIENLLFSLFFFPFNFKQFWVANLLRHSQLFRKRIQHSFRMWIPLCIFERILLVSLNTARQLEIFYFHFGRIGSCYYSSEND